MELDPCADGEDLHGGQAAFVDRVDVVGSLAHDPIALK